MNTEWTGGDPQIQSGRPTSEVILASPNTLGQSPNARLVVTMMDALVEPADGMQYKPTTGLALVRNSRLGV